MGIHGAPVDATWAWKLTTLPEETATVAIDIYPNDTPANSSKNLTEGSPPCEALRFLQDNTPEGDGLVKLLLPVHSGYVVQSDFLERRMVDCVDVPKVQGFVTPAQHIKGCTAEVYQSMSLSNLLACCYGAVVVQNAAKSAEIDAELVKRLSFTWLSPNHIPRKRLALVGAGSLPKVHGYLVAAASLNIALVVFDEACHWMLSNAYRHLRQEFVPLDMTVTADMAQRISREEFQNTLESDDGIETLIVRGVLQLIVDKWEMPTGTGTGTGVPVKVSSVTIVRQQDGDIKVDGEELIIGFQQLFLRHPAPGQGDIVFAHDNLEELADCVWTASGSKLR